MPYFDKLLSDRDQPDSGVHDFEAGQKLGHKFLQASIAQLGAVRLPHYHEFPLWLEPFLIFSQDLLETSSQAVSLDSFSRLPGYTKADTECSGPTLTSQDNQIRMTCGASFSKNSLEIAICLEGLHNSLYVDKAPQFSIFLEDREFKTL